MTTYDLDRWSRSIRNQGSNPASASLTLHLHPSHCRFEHQNGVFLYDSPIRGLLENIRDARLPVELLDLLDATDVVYYEGCLVVEVHDHRELDVNGTEGDGTASSGGKDGLNHPLSGGLSSFSSNGSVLGKRGNDGSLLNKQQQASNTASDQIAGTSSSSSSSSSSFHRTFLVTFRRFEEARREASKMAIDRAARVAAVNAAKAAAAAQAAAQEETAATGAAGNVGSPRPSPPKQQLESTSATALSSGMSSALHSAVAAAVASAPVPVPSHANDKQEAAAKKTPIPIYRVVLGPDIETVWTDLVTMREEKKRNWSETDLLEMESRVLALTAPPLCLAPDMQVSRIANALLDATSLPYDSPIPLRSPPLSHPPKVVKKLKKKGAASLDPAQVKNKKQKRAKALPSKEDTEKLLALHKAEEEEAAAAQLEAERLEAQSWLLIMDEKNAASSSLLSRHGAGFQPSFSRFAFLLDYKDKKEDEKRRGAEVVTREQEQEGKTSGKDGNSDIGVSVPQSPSKQNRENLQTSRSASHSRQGSIIDVPVPGGSTGARRMDLDDSRLPNASNNNSSVSLGASTGAGGNPVKKKKKAAAIAGDASTGGSGPTSLKLTLPGGKKSENKKKAAKAGSPDISVGSPPVSAVPGSATSAKGQQGGQQQQPTAAQQAIMRKTANLPKAKLKSDVKGKGAGAGAGGGQGSPAQAAGTLPPNAGQNMVNNLTLPNMGGNNNNNQQRNNQFSSPMQVQGALPPQQQQQQLQNQQQAMQQAYNQLQQNGMMQGRQMTGSPFNGNGMNMQLPGGGQQQQNFAGQGNPQQPNNGQFMNIHRSPVYGNAALPQQMGTPQPQSHQGYNPYNPSASPSSNQQTQLSGVQQSPFTAQQAFQLQQLQQQQAHQQQHQQQSLMHHQQALQNHVSSLPTNFNAATLFAAAAAAGQGNPNPATGAAGPNGQPQIQIPPPPGGGQGNVPQFNPQMLNQLRQQQLLAGNGTQGYALPQNQQQQQQMQWNGQR